MLFLGKPGSSSEQSCEVVAGIGTVSCPGEKCLFGCLTSCGQKRNGTDVNTCCSKCEDDDVKALCCE